MAELESEEVLQSLYGDDLISCDLPNSLIVHVVPPPLQDLILNEGLSMEKAEGIHVEVCIPDGFPHAPMTKDHVQLHSAWMSTDLAMEIVESALMQFTVDDFSLFGFIEAVKAGLPLPPERYWPSALQEEEEDQANGAAAAGLNIYAGGDQQILVPEKMTRFDFNACPFPITVGEPFTDRKSTFQGFAARVHSVEDANIVIRFLKTNGKIAQATHNITAYRLVQDGRSNHDHDSDGEDAAGGRVQHLLQIAGVENAVVVVSRWFGGIHLGPDRFKHINNTARGVLQQGGFLPEKGSKKAGAKS